MTVPLQSPASGPSFRHPYMSKSQAKWIFDLINTRSAEGTPEREYWKVVYLIEIHDRKSFEGALAKLRELPVLEHKVPETASAEGLYLDPTTQKMYRLTRNNQGELIVSSYSKTAARRIDLATGEEVRKGTWRRWNAFQSRQALLPRPYKADQFRILAEWQMTNTDKVEYVTGICNFCYRGLEDARSLRMNYGPKCAVKEGLPWGD